MLWPRGYSGYHVLSGPEVSPGLWGVDVSTRRRWGVVPCLARSRGLARTLDGTGAILSHGTEAEVAMDPPAGMKGERTDARHCLDVTTGIHARHRPSRPGRQRRYHGPRGNRHRFR